MKTLAEQLAAAQELVASLTTEKNSLNAQVTSANEAKVKAENDLKVEQTAHAETKGKLAMEQTAHSTTKADLATANAEVTKLKGEAKTAEQRAIEIAAAAGATPVKADGDKGAGKEQEQKTTLTGLAAVEEQYRKYDVKPDAKK